MDIILAFLTPTFVFDASWICHLVKFSCKQENNNHDPRLGWPKKKKKTYT